MLDEFAIQMLSGITQRAVNECLEGVVKRPRAQSIVDWRQNFVVTDPGTAKVIYNISHHLPFDPKAGEIWKISTQGYGGSGSNSEEKIAVEIERVVFDWNPQRYDNNELSGWFLEIDIFCHLYAEGADWHS